MVRSWEIDGCRGNGKRATACENMGYSSSMGETTELVHNERRLKHQDSD
jgi:hypothetical protein